MRKVLHILFIFLSISTTYSQAPQGFNYQAIIRDINGNIRSNQGVQFIFEIRNAAGDAVYTEAHTTLTNKYGLVDNIIIGQGSTADNFSNINWGTGTYFVNVKVDGVDMGTSQLLSVPYALYALSSGTGSGGVDGIGIESTIDNEDGTFTLNYTDGTSFTTIDFSGKDGKDGEDGLSGKSAYQLWLDLGNIGTEAQFIASLKGIKGDPGIDGDPGIEGKSAYQLWLDQGNSGNEMDFLSSIEGPVGPPGERGIEGLDGKSAYEVWKDLGNIGTEAEFISSFQGTDGTNGIDGSDANVTATNVAAAGAVMTTGDQTVAGTKTFSSTISGSVDGNAATATKLLTVREIAGNSFDGSADITIASTDLSDITSAGSGAIITSAERTKLSGIEASADVTDATNVAAAGAVMTTGDQTVAGTKTFSSTISGSVDGNAATATKLASAVTIGDVSFDGSTNIDLPGVNATGNQNTTGSAASLTTARRIAGVSFDGSSNIDLSLDGFSDVMANTTNFTNSILLGQSSTGTLNSANFNVGLGYGVFNSLTEGDGNMATGYNALNSLTEGGGNVAIGRQVLSKLTTGSKNVGIGRQAAIKIVDGSVGGTSLTTGSQNTFIGAETVPSANNVSNETVIGFGATGSGSNTITLGNSLVTLVGVSANNTADLGSSDKEFKDLYIDGTANLDAVDIDGGEIDGTAVGANSASTGNFTNLTGSGTISGFDAALNDQTNTAYTLQASDNGKVVTLNNGSDIIVTIDTDLGDGFNCLLVQKGSGQVTISAGSGVTIVNRSEETKTAGQYATVSIINIGSEQYILSGDTGS